MNKWCAVHLATYLYNNASSSPPRAAFPAACLFVHSEKVHLATTPKTLETAKATPRLLAKSLRTGEAGCGNPDPAVWCRATPISAQTVTDEYTRSDFVHAKHKAMRLAKPKTPIAQSGPPIRVKFSCLV